MGARLSKDERRAVAQRIFAALCAHYPDRHIALFEQRGMSDVKVRKSHFGVLGHTQEQAQWDIGLSRHDGREGRELSQPAEE